MGITVKAKGDYKNIRKFLKKNLHRDYHKILDAYGIAGVNALADATPADSGVTRNSWFYSITEDENGFTLTWYNTSTTKSGIPIVILLKYGHGTRNGGYVEGYDFIDPAIRPLFDKFTDVTWKEVTTS